jgi:hypothetical protein
MAILIEQVEPIVLEQGLNTNKNVTFGGTTTLNGTTVVVGPLTGYATSAQYTQGPTAAAAWAVSTTIFVNDSVTGTYKVVGISAVFGTASTSGTVQVEVATGTQAIGAGTVQNSTPISLSGTANTTVNGTVTTQTTITAGARVNLLFAGTVTNLANASINVIIQKIS